MEMVLIEATKENGSYVFCFHKFFVKFCLIKFFFSYESIMSFYFVDILALILPFIVALDIIEFFVFLYSVFAKPFFFLLQFMINTYF